MCNAEINRSEVLKCATMQERFKAYFLKGKIKINKKDHAFAFRCFKMV